MASNTFNTYNFNENKRERDITIPLLEPHQSDVAQNSFAANLFHSPFQQQLQIALRKTPFAASSSRLSVRPPKVSMRSVLKITITGPPLRLLEPGGRTWKLPSTLEGFDERNSSSLLFGAKEHFLREEELFLSRLADVNSSHPLQSYSFFLELGFLCNSCSSPGALSCNSCRDSQLTSHNYEPQQPPAFAQLLCN